MHQTKTRAVLIALAILIAGCDEEELARQANEYAARQAEQNQQITKLNEQVAEGTKRLVESDAQMRQDFLVAHRDLESERKQIATQRHRDPIIANALLDAALLVACVLPIVLAIYVVRNADKQSSDHGLAELLVQEFAIDQPMLLPRPPSELRAISNDPPASLPAK
ncbi:MAG TPA: hypothetical protein VHV55_27990 [Pirellulales bacterium]|jgi:uncharacterized coiled-coil protein SlyX|nr:hypothetical protein [Pirellulales bacterium]